MMLTATEWKEWVETCLAKKAETYLEREVSDGQIWFSAPESPPIQFIYTLFGDRNAKDPVLMTEDFVPVVVGEVEGKVWLKIEVTVSAQRINAVVNLRPGIVLGPKAQRFTHVILVPGSTTKEKRHQFKGLPKLTVRYPQRLCEPRRSGKKPPTEGRYEFWNLWAVSARPGLALIEPLTTLQECSTDAGQDYSSAARRLLDEVLGLREPVWGPTEAAARAATRAAARFRRGEVILVRFSPGVDPVPCVAVSDDLLNGRRHTHLVVLQTIPYEEGDETEASLVPIDEPVFAPNEKRSVALCAVRALTSATQTALSYSPPVYLEQTHPEVWSTLLTKLEAFYGT